MIAASACFAAGHQDTRCVLDTAANAGGLFVTPSIQIGRFRVRVEPAGVKTREIEALVETGKTLELRPVLTLGQSSATVTGNNPRRASRSAAFDTSSAAG
ncbi:MAG: hypothetical protein U0Q16_06525 [Bryobacteraceae bacterium]